MHSAAARLSREFVLMTPDNPQNTLSTLGDDIFLFVFFFFFFCSFLVESSSTEKTDQMTRIQSTDRLIIMNQDDHKLK